MPKSSMTPEDRFENLKAYPFEPHWFDWNGLTMHYVDEGPEHAPVMLMLHGMPTWSYLYRHMIAHLVDEGFRCVAPDHIGFGKSEKVLEDDWYTIENHCQAARDLIEHLDLNNVTLICQDWGGPIGLRQAVDMPDRFKRLTIMNTWLHSDFHDYSEAIHNWNAGWQPGGRFAESNPCGELMQNYVGAFPGSVNTPEDTFAAYEAPFPATDWKAGPRRFPRCIPIENPDIGNAEDQARCFRALDEWDKPIHFIWGCADNVFTEDWGDKWSSRYPQATIDKIPEAGHFLQETHGPEIVDFLLNRIDEE